MFVCVQVEKVSDKTLTPTPAAVVEAMKPFLKANLVSAKLMAAALERALVRVAPFECRRWVSVYEEMHLTKYKCTLRTRCSIAKSQRRTP